MPKGVTQKTYETFCSCCGKKIETNNPKARFCSVKCWQIVMNPTKGQLPVPKYLSDKEGVTVVERKCHDCGKITPNYRCPACWKKRKEKLGGMVGELSHDIDMEDVYHYAL